MSLFKGPHCSIKPHFSMNFSFEHSKLMGSLSYLWCVVLLSFSSLSTGSIGPLCTNWNTGIAPVCTGITWFHNFLNTLIPADLSALTLQHCDFLIITPHCCDQFCTPAQSGICEQSTGVCRCQGPGIPETCNMYFNANNSNTNPRILGYCKDKCNAGNGQIPGTCTTPAYVNDGINYLCVCYCS